MISHELKCIFIHIPRCAGSSIETWLCGQDWWSVEPSTKHLSAGQARVLYANWWNVYFKFAVVRDPYTRTRSLLKYGENYGLRKTEGRPIDFSGYEAWFGSRLIIEHDRRFFARRDLLRFRHRFGFVYGNLLDEKIDFVAHFETLKDDMELVRTHLSFPTPFSLHLEKSGERESEALTPADRAWVAKSYRKDFERFGYTR